MLQIMIIYQLVPNLLLGYVLIYRDMFVGRQQHSAASIKFCWC